MAESGLDKRNVYYHLLELEQAKKQYKHNRGNVDRIYLPFRQAAKVMAM